ncbi:Cytochrome c oxidase subunit 3 [bacterium HR15]|nr:Cytochrome c oxidase subunit 3 [bacterium HR15]
MASVKPLSKPREPIPPFGGDGFSRREQPAPAPSTPARWGVWLAIFAVAMLFAGLSSAYLVHLPQRSRFPLELPSILWANTLVLILSSFSCQWALRQARQGRALSTMQGLGLTLALGVLFLAGQVYAWQQLRDAGLHLQTHVFSSFFYVLTATHGVHLIVGVGILFGVWAVALLRQGTTLNPLAVELSAFYWHFLTLVWLWLFLLLNLKAI